ncbi:MAG: MCE family protein [Opitutaceae bacterium]|nr:MCE family protein [Verrucomicrobiales bacterium]
MGLQDLTPQLRTRLNRVERIVGLFVTTATLLMVAGFAYYIYHTAQRKGWLLTKIDYTTGIQNAAGLKVGDPVKMMGWTVGDITRIELNEPEDPLNITVFFRVNDPYYGYLWTDSKVRVTADFLGSRYLELIKGVDGIPTVQTDGKVAVGLLIRGTAIPELNKARAAARAKVEAANNAQPPRLRKAGAEFEKEMTTAEQAAVAEIKNLARNQPQTFYTPLTKKPNYWLVPLDAPALNERIEGVLNMVESALPNILSLTNQIAGTLEKATELAANANETLTGIRPIVSNLTAITASIQTGPGGLGQWLIPTNLNVQLDLALQEARTTMIQAQTTLASTDTNLTQVALQLDATLINLANITSNLNVQVQGNPAMLTGISTLIRDTDDMVQGLKRHWLLRSAYRTNAPPKVGKSPGALLPPRLK